MSLFTINPEVSNDPELVAKTRKGVTIVLEGDQFTIATGKFGVPVQGTYPGSTSLREVEEDLKSKANQ